MTACWECEQATRSPQSVVLPMTGRDRLITLCPTCFRDYYLPLLARTAGHTETIAAQRSRPPEGSTVHPGSSR